MARDGTVALVTFSETCPRCGNSWEFDDQSGHAARSFATCAYRCERCGIGYSNSRDKAKRRRITREPSDNVPPEVRGPEALLKRAVNLHSAPKKLQAFCSESSEDAVVWTVVSGLRQLERLDSLTGLSGQSKRPELLLWGAAFDDDAPSHALAGELAQACAALRENPVSLSEPDIVLAWDGHVVFIEAKYRSPNPVQLEHGGFKKYVDDPSLFAVSPFEVGKGGLYELIRNWVIGAKLAKRRGARFTLINLGGPALKSTAEEFSAQVAQGPRQRFVRRRWSEVLRAATPLPDWLEGYASERGLWEL